MSNSSQHGDSNRVSKFGIKFPETSNPGVKILNEIRNLTKASVIADMGHDGVNAYVVAKLIERANPEEIEMHKVWFVGHMAVRLANKVERFAKQSSVENPATSVIIPLIDSEFARWSQIEPKFRGHVAKILSVHANYNKYVPLATPTIETPVEAVYGDIFVNNKLLHPDMNNQPVVSDFNFIKLIETKN